jgi:hypothetical protein
MCLACLFHCCSCLLLCARVHLKLLQQLKFVSLLCCCCHADAVVVIYDDQLLRMWLDHKGRPKWAPQCGCDVLSRVVGLQVSPVALEPGADAGHVLQMLSALDLGLEVRWQGMGLCRYALCVIPRLTYVMLLCTLGFVSDAGERVEAG